MKYTLDELREYRDLLREISDLEISDLETSSMGGKTCKVCENRDQKAADARSEGRGGQFWTEERRKAQSERMKGNTIARGDPHPDDLDRALAPRPDTATMTKLTKNYHCSICNGIGHNARTCDTLFTPRRF